jgi:lipid II:glycine glycyltransferase (peptidoglycan interpeptide bridge formation enzyme)
MRVTLEPKQAKKLKSHGILQQTRWWAEMKYEQGYLPQAYHLSMEEKGHIKTEDDLLVILRETAKKPSESTRMAYIPYGPEMKPTREDEGAFLEQMARELKPNLPENCGMIRFDLKWESPWLHDENRYNDRGEWLGIPSERTQEFRMNMSTENWNLFKAPTDSLPSTTIYINLRQTDDELLSAMKPKTRYNIRLAKRRGVTVREAGIEDLNTWYKLYSETARRNNFFCHPLSFFESMHKANCTSTDIKAAGSILLIAEHEGDPLAAMWLGLSGDNATYLYGASSVHKRRNMPAYALQWAAIKKAREAGCRHYDMFGISVTADPAHPMYGLYRFKKGFGGKQFLRQGCWDYPLDDSFYQQFRSLEMNAKGYHR